ncbi:MAG: hypothetical protein AAF492_29500, partial [Verrucomicrobiota bacterium]
GGVAYCRPEVVYYTARADIDSVNRQASYTPGVKEGNMSKLTRSLRKCRAMENALKEMKDPAAASEWLAQIRLLIADAHRKTWWLSGYAWDNVNREQALAYLRQLPEDSRERVSMKLSILRTCHDRWFRWFRNDPEERVIDGVSISARQLKMEIKDLERQLAASL